MAAMDFALLLFAAGAPLAAGLAPPAVLPVLPPAVLPAARPNIRGAALPSSAAAPAVLGSAQLPAPHAPSAYLGGGLAAGAPRVADTEARLFEALEGKTEGAAVTYSESSMPRHPRTQSGGLANIEKDLSIEFRERVASFGARGISLLILSVLAIGNFKKRPRPARAVSGVPPAVQVEMTAPQVALSSQKVAVAAFASEGMPRRNWDPMGTPQDVGDEPRMFVGRRETHHGRVSLLACAGLRSGRLASSGAPAGNPLRPQQNLSSMAFLTALAAVAREKRPEEVAFRDERVKGPKAVKLGAKLQRFFSVRNRTFWDYMVYPKTYFNRVWQKKDYGYAFLFAVVHAGALCAPFFFTWKAFATFAIGYLITGLGITLSYHRQLAHRSFKSPKIVEYICAYAGALAMQSHPINWVSSHRHHHGATDTENDVHSPKDGFWWAHAGWLLDQKGTWMRKDKNNASDLSAQWYYRHMQKFYALHAIVLPIAGLYAFGGLPCVLWGWFFRVCWVWHITWAVNSVSHVWGFQDWNTGDISMNNWFIGILALGEGWHNNHHAFENSCRHGLKWWMIDLTWYTIKAMEKLGLAYDLKYPSEGKIRKLTFPTEPGHQGGASNVAVA